jgi:hypothetical protein
MRLLSLSGYYFFNNAEKAAFPHQTVGYAAGIGRAENLRDPQPEGHARCGPCHQIKPGETRTLIQAVKRNSDRFPDDFMFQLSAAEAAGMRSQTVIASRRNTRYLPYAFTELGVAMLSSVLSSERAVQMNIVIMRAFVKLREVLASHRSLAAKIGKLDAVQKDHASILTIVIKDIENLAKGVAKEFEKAETASAQS